MKVIMTFSISFFWSMATLFIRLLVKFSFLPQKNLGTRVISIGNIQAGGTGKTPLIVQIAQEAERHHLSICILTRGYKSKIENQEGVITPGSERLDPEFWGDEPVLISSLCPQAWIVVGRNRIQAFKIALKKRKKPFDLILLDDGFQHWKIKKDLEILAWTSQSWGSTFFRDFSFLIHQADLVVWTKGSQSPPIDSFVQVEYDLSSSLKNNISSDKKLSFWLVTGVAQGDLVKKTLKDYFKINQLPHEIVHHIQYQDHAKYHLDQVRKILEDAHLQQAKVILTGKDWVKWHYLGILKSEVIVIEPTLKLIKGEELWESTLWGKSH